MVDQAQTPLELILREIEMALDADLNYLAIAVTLAIPEICVSLECDPGKMWVDEKKYVAWYDANITASSLRGIDCWRLRGGVVHHGGFASHPKSEFRRIIFTLLKQGSVDSNLYERAGEKPVIDLDVKVFCATMAIAARDWFKRNEDNPNVKANLPHMVQYRGWKLPIGVVIPAIY